MFASAAESSARPTGSRRGTARFWTWPPTITWGWRPTPASRPPRSRAIERDGTGARASRVVTGTVDAHLELERELCALTGQPAALVFSSGYLANLGILTALGRPGAVILTDGHIHASLIDAARLSRATVEPFPHGDLAALQSALASRDAQRAIVVVESIYSVLGDACDLDAPSPPCVPSTTRCWSLTKPTASASPVAAGGRCTQLDWPGPSTSSLTATMSKALGAQGGAVLGSPALREHLVNTARSFIFDTGLAPAVGRRRGGRVPHRAGRTATGRRAEPQRRTHRWDLRHSAGGRSGPIVAAAHRRGRHPHRRPVAGSWRPRRVLPSAERSRWHIPAADDGQCRARTRPGRRGRRN